MPENGWSSVLTVREHTAKTIKKMAKDRCQTVNELVNELINPEVVTRQKDGQSVKPVAQRSRP